MSGESRPGGKKNKRPDNRPCRKRYTSEMRWIKNKARKIAKEAARQKKIEERKKRLALDN